MENLSFKWNKQFSMIYEWEWGGGLLIELSGVHNHMQTKIEFLYF